MLILMSSRWLFFFLLIIFCILIISEGKGGRGGGGGRSGGSRGGSSRSSSGHYSSSTSSRGSGHYSPSSSSSSSSSSRGSGHYSPSSSSSSSSSSRSGHYSPSSSSSSSSSSRDSSHYAPSSSSSSSSSSRGGHYSSSSSSKGGGYNNRGGSNSGKTEPSFQHPFPSQFQPPRKPPTSEVVRQPPINLNFMEWNPSRGFIYKQPASNPNYKGSNPNLNQQPPPYSPRQNPPPYSPNQGVPPPPPYSPHGSPNFRQQYLGEAPPPYPGRGVPGVIYPGQSGMPSGNFAQKSGVPGANYPRQPGMPGGNYVHQGGVPGANYPRQPSMPGGNYVQPGGVPGANYPRQPGMPDRNYNQQGGGIYPKQPGTFGQPGVGIPGANYPRQIYYPANTLGSKVWHPESGKLAPAYMNYGGLPTGSNMHSKPETKKGFLGSLMSMGSHKPKKNKHFGSQPSPYGMRGKSPMGEGFMGKHGSKAAMHTILPYMETGKSPKFSRPRFGYHPVFWHRPVRVHHHHHGYKSHSHFDIDDKEYVGRCNRPLTPNNGKVACYSNRDEVDCDVKCEEGYLFPDNATRKWNKCWHVSGVWKPMKNFPACQPVCNKTCLNGGTCIGPDVCACPSEYRGFQCQIYGKCDQPLAPDHGKVTCNSSQDEVDCEAKCEDGYLFPDNTTRKENKCWPFTGVWEPEKSFPACQPVCNRTCLNGGTCIGPNVCGCPPEYRGLQCEFYFLKCDIRKLANGARIKWMCTHSKNETTCKVKCQDSLQFATPTEVYKCSPDGVWTPNSIPECVST